MAYLYQCWSCMSFIFCTLRHFPILYRLPSLGLVHHVLKHLHDTSTCQIQDATTRGITSVLYPWQHIGIRHTYIIASCYQYVVALVLFSWYILTPQLIIPCQDTLALVGLSIKYTNSHCLPSKGREKGWFLLIIRS